MQNTVRQNHRPGVSLSTSSIILLAMFLIVSVLFGIEIFGIIFMYHSVDMRLQQTSALKKNMQSTALIQHQSDPLHQGADAITVPSSDAQAPPSDTFLMYPALVREEQTAEAGGSSLAADVTKGEDKARIGSRHDERKAQDVIMFMSLILSTVCAGVLVLFTRRRGKKAEAKRGKKPSYTLIETLRFFFEFFANIFDRRSMDGEAFSARKNILPIKDFQKTIIDPAAFPTISFNIPVKNETLHGSSSLQINVEDKNSYVDHVNLLVDNKIIGVLRNKPYTFTYDTTALRNNSWHRFLALAIDKYGTLLSKASIVVRIENKGH